MIDATSARSERAERANRDGTEAWQLDDGIFNIPWGGVFAQGLFQPGITGAVAVLDTLLASVDDGFEFAVRPKDGRKLDTLGGLCECHGISDYRLVGADDLGLLVVRHFVGVADNGTDLAGEVGEHAITFCHDDDSEGG